MPTNPRPRGGARPGAGRPPLAGEPMRQYRVSLPASDWERLRSVGSGNASAGIRRLLKDLPPPEK